MPRLVIESGAEKGRVFRLPPKGTFGVGRDERCAIRLTGQTVSRVHCVVIVQDGECAVEDRSANGTFVNDERIAKRTLLHPGDVVRTGDSSFSVADSQTDPQVGKVIAGYRLEKRLGKGAVGTVYRAVQLSLDRTVALKILSEKYTGDEKFVRIFVDEARAAGRLNHPNVVQVYDAGNDGDQYYISMEFLENGTLEDLLEEKGRIPVANALTMAIDACRALYFAEQNHIVHRDIKPSNLLISKDGTVKVGDLGIATDLRSNDSGQGTAAGSPRYMAPEQALKKDVDNRADIYALGSTLYRAISGMLPFDGASSKEILKAKINERPLSLLVHEPELLPIVANTVHKMLEKDPERRFQSAKDLDAALGSALARVRRSPRGTGTVAVSSGGPGPDPEPKPKTRAAPKRPMGMGIGVAIGIAIVIGIIAWFAVDRFLGVRRDVR